MFNVLELCRFQYRSCPDDGVWYRAGNGFQGLQGRPGTQRDFEYAQAPCHQGSRQRDGIGSSVDGKNRHDRRQRGNGRDVHF